jgi:hypothetical protein
MLLRCCLVEGVQRVLLAALQALRSGSSSQVQQAAGWVDDLAG